MRPTNLQSEYIEDETTTTERLGNPQKGWETENLFVPPGFHIDSKIEGEGEKPKGETGEQPFIYPMGVGGLIMNGCFATNYQKGDPCYEAKWKTTICLVNKIF